ncbi:uncharacterized protein [Clytia hemisphaerica]|uniref:Uncharacterized protein n=1 Tax=Clytia hemisphaerica TaxID=252671 RepID=A0A7M5X7C6_9CNID
MEDKDTYHMLPINVFIDEFPQEFLTESYVNKLQIFLETKFRDSTFVLALQSVYKRRELCTKGKTEVQEHFDLAKSKMTVFNLTKTMRMSVDIHQMVEILQNQIEKDPIVIPLENEPTFLEKILTTPFWKKSADEKKTRIKTESTKGAKMLESNRIVTSKNSEKRDIDAATEDKSNKTTIEPNNYLSNILRNENPVKYVEDMAKFTDPEKMASEMKLKSGNATKTLKTNLSYVKGSSGHNIHSDTKPRIVYLDRKFVPYSYEVVPCLSMIFKKYAREDLKLTVICNTLEQVRVIEIVLNNLYGWINIGRFIPSLLEEYPSPEDKKAALSRSNKVLITDYRAFRGCEIEHCVLFLDPSEQIAKNMYTEILTRAINQLVLLVQPSTQTDSFMLTKVLKEWQLKDLVNTTKAKLSKERDAEVKISLTDEKGPISQTFKISDEEMERFQSKAFISKRPALINNKWDARMNNKEVKLLLLGTHDSGKSTMIKQMRCIAGKLSEDEYAGYRELVYHNILNSIQDILQAALGVLNIEFGETGRYKDARQILSLDVWGDEWIKSLSVSNHFTTIKRLWNDEGVQKCFQRLNEYYLNESAKYFLDDLDRIAASDYYPTQQDVFRVHWRTIGIKEDTFSYRGLNYGMVDTGGTRFERKKWKHTFENVTAVIYCVAISEYDLSLDESENVNRLEESINLLKSISEHQMLKNKQIILFLNKTDVFSEKMQKFPLKDYFPEYTGTNTYEGSTFIREKLESVCGRAVHTYFTCAIDTKNFQNVFDLVHEVVLENLH